MLSAAVVVCTASRARTEMLRACVDALLAGSRAPDELIVVVDNNPRLRAELALVLPPSARLLGSERHGLSEARNAGMRATAADVVAFVDDDAAVDRDWLSSLVEAFEADGEILGLGGPVLPSWGAQRRWLPDELLWIVGCTYRGHREDAGPIRNPIGCNMAFRRRELIAAGGFASGFGKRGDALETCDETELSLRIQRAYGAGRIRYLPQARVRHHVPASRISWRLLIRRSLSEGLAKGRLHRLYRQPALAPERSYALQLVGRAVPRLFLTGLLRRDRELLLGAGSILLSLLITACAFAAGLVKEAHREAR